MAQVRLAVLIDADNAQSDLIAPLLAEIARYGTATTRRIYGDWTKPHLVGWKEKLLQHAIQPIQQFAYTSGKNATDSALIIDAMDLLYSGRFEGFCLVSSDSDFTRLASRLRESGLLVYGFGEQKTPKPLVAACDKFTYVEVLREPTTVADAAPVSKPRLDGKLHKLLDAAFNASAGEGDWVHLGAMGSQLSKQAPDFDARNYGHKRLSDLVRATSRFELEERKGADGKSLSHYLRRK